jgi:hypothetical protein
MHHGVAAHQRRLQFGGVVQLDPPPAGAAPRQCPQEGDIRLSRWPMKPVLPVTAMSIGRLAAFCPAGPRPEAMVELTCAIPFAVEPVQPGISVSPGQSHSAIMNGRITDSGHNQRIMRIQMLATAGYPSGLRRNGT